MKKNLILLGSAMVLALASNAQEAPASGDALKSKKGEMILPEAKDWSIGIDASPFFEYAGSIFNNNENNNAPTWDNFTNNFSMIGKMFADDKTAYRAVIAITKENFSNSNQITKAVALPAPNQYFGEQRELVTDTWKRSSNNSFVVGGGYEKRRGTTRLQGFYGGEVLVAFQGAFSDKFTYGNALTQNPSADQPNVNPGDATYSTNFTGGNLLNGNDILLQNAAVNSARILEQKTGSSFAFGIRGFIGAEYFFMPKMCIGGEFGWGLACQTFAKTTTTYEAEGKLSDGSEAAATVEEKSLKSKSFGINDDRVGSTTAITDYLAPQGRLRLSFHF